MITPISFNNIGFQTYTIFAIINALMVPSVYFFYPETAYRSLEEMDGIFHKVHGVSGYFDVVKVAREEPRRYGKNGELLIEYEKTDEHRGNVSHADSAVNGGNDGLMVARDAEQARGASSHGSAH